MENKLFSSKEAFSHGLEVTKKNFWFLAGVLLFIFLLSTGTNVIPGLSFLVGIFASISLLTMALEMSEGRDFPVKNFFSKYHLVLSYLVASVLYGVMVVIGLIFFIIPGLYLLVKYQFFRFLIIDKGIGPIEALKESGRITDGHLWQLFVFVILSLLINLLGVIALGVGLFVSVPVTIFASIYIYKKLLSGSHLSS
jgi:uncharacterized membrane protein